MDIDDTLPPAPSAFSSRRVFLGLACLISFACTGCGIIFGGDQKVDTKSRDYSILRLDREPNGEWLLLSEVEIPNKDGFPQDRTDVAFENKSTKAIISLNSVCGGATDPDLERLSKNLLMGLGDNPADIQTERIQIDGAAASQSTLDTTVSVKEVRQGTKVRTVVLYKSGCTYDFMYIAKPPAFDKTLEDFNAFLKGFHVK